MSRLHPLAEEIISWLETMTTSDMIYVAQVLESKNVTELHRLISKATILRALLTVALQEKKFPIDQ